MKQNRLILPKRQNIYKTGPTDPVHYHYVPLLRYIMNKRLTMALRLLNGEKFEAILDAGCGDGIMFPELSQRCNQLYAIDIHDNLERVKEMAEREGISVVLKRSGLEIISFENETFDCIVSLSVLEFIKDLEKVFDEFYRITKRNSTIIIGFPVINILTDISYLAIGVTNTRKIHLSTHNDIIREAKKKFELEETKKFPFFLPVGLSLFICCKLKRR